MKDHIFFSLFVHGRTENLQVCVFICVWFPCACLTCRGEGDVMFSLCLANPVVSTPNSRVYGV